jgi:hypothetical protein
MRTLKIKPVKNDKGRIVEYEIFENEEYMNTAFDILPTSNIKNVCRR